MQENGIPLRKPLKKQRENSSCRVFGSFIAEAAHWASWAPGMSDPEQRVPGSDAPSLWRYQSCMHKILSSLSSVLSLHPPPIFLSWPCLFQQGLITSAFPTPYSFLNKFFNSVLTTYGSCVAKWHI